MAKVSAVVYVLVALLFGGITGYFVRDAQDNEEKVRRFARMPAPAAGPVTVASMVPESSSREYAVILNCSGIISCEARLKNGSKVPLHVIREKKEIFVLLGEAKFAWPVFVQAFKNKEFQLPDFENGRLTVPESSSGG